MKIKDLSVESLRRRTVGRLARAYGNEWIRRPVSSLFVPRYPEKWVFLVGCYNSGTTLTQRLLGAHPDVRSLPMEGAFLTSVLPVPEDLGWVRMWVECQDYMEMLEKEEPEKAQRVIRDWTPWWGRGGRAFMDKSVSNGTRMRWLDCNFENAYFIGIVRNGYCAAEGIRRRARPRGEAAASVGDKYPIRLAGRQWVEANERIIADSKNVANFKLIFYEELVQEPAWALEEIWQFLGLECPPMTREGHALDVAGERFAIRDMNEASLARLTHEDVLELDPVLSEMQLRLGYEVIR